MQNQVCASAAVGRVEHAVLHGSRQKCFAILCFSIFTPPMYLHLLPVAHEARSQPHIASLIAVLPTSACAALNEEAGKLLLEGFEEFAKKARLMTSIHAKKLSVLTAAGGANAVNADGTAAASAEGKLAAGGAGSGTMTAMAAAKPGKAAASKLAEKKKSLKRL